MNLKQLIFDICIHDTGNELASIVDDTVNYLVSGVVDTGNWLVLYETETVKISQETDRVHEKIRRQKSRDTVLLRELTAVP